jgi:hypothetical protein
VKQAFIVALSFMVCLTASAGELDRVLSSIEAAYGGAEAVKRLDSYRLEGRVDRIAGDSGQVIRDYLAPDRMKVGIVYPDRTEVRLVVGDEAWHFGRSGGAKVRGSFRAAMVYQLLRSSVPGVLLRNRDRLEDRGLVEHAGGAHRMLAIRWSEDLEMRYWVEVGTNRVTHVEGTLRMGSRDTVFATEYRDFRTVEGALFPFREKNYASGRHVADTITDTVTVGISDPGPFEPPPGLDSD